ncbi:hypothetical protein C8Q70DRAFT_1051593 [Cubamyces menziesii]|nr:hypothetical protein C8Q70DRAFT_1051593 [Cubamyces menziesii]
MSTDSESEIIQSIATITLDNRIGIAAVVLLIYEHVITFGPEVQYVWARKKTGASLLFISIRYTAFLSLALLEALSYLPDMPKEYILWAAFSALRALALSEMNWTLASAVFIIACGPTVINLWDVFGVGIVGQNIPMFGCVSLAQPTASQAQMGMAPSYQDTSR